MLNTVLCDLPTTIGGFVVHNQDDSCTVVLNSKLTWEDNMESYIHELKHLEEGDLESLLPADVIEKFSHM